MASALKACLGLTTALCALPAAAWAQVPAPGQSATPDQQTLIPQTPAQQPVTPTPTPAATSPAAAVEDQQPAAGTGVGDIIVTATRRATNLQQVPATIDVASSAQLAAVNVQDTQGVEKLVPGVTMARSGGVTPFIRGIGTFNAGFSEASVALYVDGIFLPNSAGALFSFNNVERIEVLKGPQGTLYGRNTTGGLINVITRQPDDHATMDASLAYGNYNTFTQNFYGSTPITDNLAVNLAVYHQKQADGWSHNLFTGDDTQKSEETGVYGKLRWDAGSKTKITLSGLYDYSNSSKGWAFAIVPGTFGLDGTPYLGRYNIRQRLDPNARYHSFMGSFRIDQDFGFANFFSLSAYQYGTQTSRLSQNGIAGNPVAGQSSQDVFIDFDSKTFSQEFQLNSKGHSRFEWVAGAYYYNDTTNVETALTTTCVGTVCAPIAGGAPRLVHARPTTRSYSGYADGTYNVFDHTHLTLGIRYTDETKGFSGSSVPLLGYPNSNPALPTIGLPANVPGSVRYPKVTFRGVLAQDFTDDFRGYISFNRGFKAGAYNPNNIANPPVKPEILDSYEAGLKSELFNHLLRLNVSGFYYDYSDIQVRSNFGPPGTPNISQNVGKAHIKGADAQFDMTPFRGFTLSGGAEYLNANIVDYPGFICVAPRLPPFPPGVLGGGVAVSCQPNNPNNVAGYPLPISPNVTLNMLASYQLDTDVGTFTLVGNEAYKARFTFAYDNSVQQPPYAIVDASLTWRTTNKRYDVKLFVDNMFNRYYFQAGQGSSQGFVYVPGAPRTFGVAVGVHL